LYRLHILTTTTTTTTAASSKDAGSEPGQAQALKLTDPFAKSLRLALTGGGSHRSFGVPCSTPEEHRVDVKFLDAFAKTQWESILHYMVGSATGGSGGGGGGAIAPRGPSSGVKKLLEMGGLVEVKGRQPEITQAGFAFLLQDINTQIWTLLVFYLENAEGVRFNDDILSPRLFLFIIILYVILLLAFTDKSLRVFFLPLIFFSIFLCQISLLTSPFLYWFAGFLFVFSFSFFLFAFPAEYGRRRRALVPVHARQPRARPRLHARLADADANPHARRPARLWHHLPARVAAQLLLAHTPRHDADVRRRRPAQRQRQRRL
jgi:hypothetical protein